MEEYRNKQYEDYLAASEASMEQPYNHRLKAAAEEKRLKVPVGVLKEEADSIDSILDDHPEEEIQETKDQMQLTF